MPNPLLKVCQSVDKMRNKQAKNIQIYNLNSSVSKAQKQKQMEF